MKALTICQPYAELIARNEKPVENRTWPASYRGPLLIHAGKSRAWLDGETDVELAEEFGRQIEFGAIIAECILLDCVKVERIERGEMDERYPFLQGKARSHCNGPWCWILGDIKRFVTAIPWKGAQGLWDCDFTPSHFATAYLAAPPLQMREGAKL